MNKQKGVIIGGHPSSGSTLLSLMLDSHPDLICGPELTIFSHSLLWENEGFNANNADKAFFSHEQLTGVLEWSCVDSKSLDYYHTNKREVIDWLSSSANLYEFGNKFFQRKMEEKKAQKWIEKTPQNLYAISAYLKANKDSSAIIMIRDPRSVMSSLLRRGFSDEVVARICFLEENIIYNLLNNNDFNNRLHLVQYEHLVGDTKNTLDKICSFLCIQNESELMMNRDRTERKNTDKSLIKTEGSSSNSWQYSPTESISDEAIYSWKKELNAKAYDLFLHAKMNADVIHQYLGSDNKDGELTILSANELMSYFGYSIMPSIEENCSDFECFYIKQVVFNLNMLIGKATLPIIHNYFKKMNFIGLLDVVFFLVKIIFCRILFFFKRKIIKTNVKTILKFVLPRKVLNIYRQKKQNLSNLKNKILPKYNNQHEWHAPETEIKKCDLVVAIAFLERHSVLNVVINEVFEAKSLGIDVAIILSCSNQDDLNFAKRMQQKYKNIGIVFCENKPLGNKWFFASEYSKKFNPRALLITGSDDLISSDYIKNNYYYLINDELETIGMIGPRVWYILDDTKKDFNATLWKVAYYNEYHHMPLGAGRMYSAQYLETIDWQIFDRNLDALLDDKGYSSVLEQELNVYSPTLDDGFIVSIKGRWVAMNSLEIILAAPSITSTQVVGEEKDNVLNKIKKSLELCH